MYSITYCQGQPFCSLPNACPLSTRELPGETLRLHTCIGEQTQTLIVKVTASREVTMAFALGRTFIDKEHFLFTE